MMQWPEKEVSNAPPTVIDSEPGTGTSRYKAAEQPVVPELSKRKCEKVPLELKSDVTVIDASPGDRRREIQVRRNLDALYLPAKFVGRRWLQ